jgi:hypothetical protein
MLLSNLRQKRGGATASVSLTGGGKRKRKHVTSALSCLALLSNAVGPALEPYVDDTLAIVFSEGLSQEVTDLLCLLARNVPSKHSSIRYQLLEYVGWLLGNGAYRHPGNLGIFRCALSLGFHRPNK